jgi:hypothetical protein
LPSVVRSSCTPPAAASSPSTVLCPTTASSRPRVLPGSARSPPDGGRRGHGDEEP